MPKPELNQPLPPFSLPAAVPGPEGTVETKIANADLAGKPFVLFFYPRDNTSGCTVEACGFAALSEEFAKLGVQVLGISRDTVRSHSNFIKKQNLTYPLLADLGAELIQNWDLLIHKTMYGKPVTVVARNTYYVDKEGVVRQIWEKVSPPGHPQEVLEYVRGLSR